MEIALSFLVNRWASVGKIEKHKLINGKMLQLKIELWISDLTLNNLMSKCTLCEAKEKTPFSIDVRMDFVFLFHFFLSCKSFSFSIWQKFECCNEKENRKSNRIMLCSIVLWPSVESVENFIAFFLHSHLQLVRLCLWTLHWFLMTR